MLGVVPESNAFEWIPPMKAAVGLPHDQSGWVAELKWDGIRTQILTDGDSTVLRSSSGRDITKQFPDMADFGHRLGTGAALDGEIVVFDGDRPSFQRVLQRLNVDKPNPALIAANPAVYIVFDLVRLGSNSMIDLPYRTRRQIMHDLLADGPYWRVPPYVEEGAEELMELARQRDLEGIVVKRLDSVYKPGARSHDWRKVKIRLHQEFVVGGWLAGQGALEDEIGSLVVGTWDGADLVVAGTAGSGLTDDERRRLAKRFIERADSPFVALPPLDRRPTWVEPTTVVEVQFGDWPRDGMLRHPVYMGIREDKDPKDVVREIEPPGKST
ncbi:MAG: ATP-dependent DNA ligase [Acidimicrobiales bacterium]